LRTDEVVFTVEKRKTFVELEAAIRAVSGRFRPPKVTLRQDALSVSQDLHCYCDTTPNNGGAWQQDELF
jgi:hypothetical protein